MTAPPGIHVVRHGQSTWNAAGRVQGQVPHVPLTPLGEQQARAAARRLAGSGARAVYSSDLLRAAATAAPIAGLLGVPVTLDPDLRERSMGRLEGQRSADAWALPGADWGDPGWSPPGGESISDVSIRVRRFVRALEQAARGAPVVVVTHGDTAGILLAALRGLPEGELPWAALANGEVRTVPWPAGKRLQESPERAR